jgi:ATP-binding cassette subfamily B protein
MNTLRPILHYMRRRSGRIVLGIFVLTLCNCCELVQPRIWKGVVDGLTSGGTTQASLLAAAAILLGIALGRSGFSLLQRWLLLGNARMIEYDLRNDFFEHLQRLPPSFFVRWKTGDLMSRATSDVNAVRLLPGMGVLLLVDSINMLGISLFFMLHTSPFLTAVAMAPLLAIPPLVARFSRAIHQRYERVQEHLARMSTRVQENFSGVRVIKAFVQEGSEVLRFGKMNDEYIRLALHEAKVEVPFNPLLGLCAGLGVASAVLVGGWLVAGGKLGWGDFVAFDWYLAIATGPMTGFGMVITLWQKGSASMGRLQEVMSADPEIVDPPDALTLSTMEGRISLRGLTVRHPRAGRPALDGVSAEIPAGAFVGVIGPVGSGKSTLLDAIARLVQVPEGQLCIGGHDVRRLSLSSVRQAIGIAPQEPLLFSDTIGNNIAFGRPDASPERIAEAARAACIDAEVREFPDGYDQRVGERGLTLSGGQRQRLALARALLREPAILLLDNSLSSVDAQTEQGILATLRSFRRGRTTLMVTHRVSAVRDADLILVMKEGRVVERGRHDELCSKAGEYAWLCRQQRVGPSVSAAK